MGDPHPADEGCGPAPAVLVVDDDVPLRSLLKGVLDDCGCRTETAASGAEALRLLASRRFDILVLDLQMPVMGGAELYRRLEQRGDLPPTIIISAHYEARQVARDLGAPVMLPKPFDIDDLCRTVLALYRHERRRGPEDQDKEPPARS